MIWGYQTNAQQQKVSYAKSKSNILVKLDGAFKMPSSTPAIEMTSAQKRAFNAPVPGSAEAVAATPSVPSGLPSKPQPAAANVDDSRGQKRPREEEDEEEDEDSDVAMEEDSDDD